MIKKIANIIKKLGLEPVEIISRLAATGNLKTLTSFILYCAGKKVSSLGVIYDYASAKIPLFPSSSSTTTIPDFGFNKPKLCIREHSALNAYLLKDVKVSAYSSSVLMGDYFLIPEEQLKQRGRIPSNGAGLGYYDKHSLISTINGVKSFKKAIHLGGDGANNWYHFVIECMSKAYITRFLPASYDDYPVILCSEALNVPSFRDLLQAIIPEREILITGVDVVNVQNLIVIDEVSIGPFNLYPNNWPRLSDYSQHDNIMNMYCNELRKNFIASDAGTGNRRRIFLVRPNVRRKYNQDQLVAIAKKFGFETVSTEDLSLKEQALLFSESSHVVGASGAAWTNIIFACQSIQGLSWILPQYNEFCSYSMLAQLLGHKLRYIENEPSCKIRSTDDGYKSPYFVCPKEFERALTELFY